LLGFKQLNHMIYLNFFHHDYKKFLLQNFS